MVVGAVFSLSIDILKYIIYGLAAGFFVFGVLLLVEGFFTTGAIRDLYGEFKITACGRCLTAFVSHNPPPKKWQLGNKDEGKMENVPTLISDRRVCACS